MRASFKLARHQASGRHNQRPNQPDAPATVTAERTEQPLVEQPNPDPDDRHSQTVANSPRMQLAAEVVSTEIPTIWPVCAGYGVSVDLRAPHSDDVDRTF
jgi:hypothetical protein